jgi:Mg-chelatase subunit ChlD
MIVREGTATQLQSEPVRPIQRWRRWLGMIALAGLFLGGSLLVSLTLGGPALAGLEPAMASPSAPLLPNQPTAIAPTETPPDAECPRAQPIDLVIAMDHSGSMADEFDALCAKIPQIESQLKDAGIEVRVSIFAMTRRHLCAKDVLSSHPAGGSINSPEDWGPAVTALAGGFDWLPDATRLIIPMSDEGPENGSPVDAEDRTAIDEAIAAAVKHGVVVSPVLGSGHEHEPAIAKLAHDLASATGGQVFESRNPAADLANGVSGLIQSAGCGAKPRIYLPLVFHRHCQLGARPQDIVLVLDTSSSMREPALSGGSKMESVRRSAGRFVEMLDLDRHRIGLVGFDERALRIAGLTHDRAALSAAIAALEPGLGTRIDRGLLEAHRMLLLERRRTARPVVIMLTDGQQAGSFEPDLQLRADELRELGATVFVIGLGAGVDRDRLLALASSEAHYFASPDDSQLGSIYMQIALDFACR